jgi:membrane protease YdiL (CAAX protease family)
LVLAVVGLGASFALGLPLDWLSVEPRALATSMGIAVLVWLALLPVLLHSARRPEIQAAYPELRVSPRTRGIVGASALAWGVYLVGYELLFRGFLLHWGISLWGLWFGIAAMTLIYVAAHLRKPRVELLVCFVVGPAFAGLTLGTGSIWAVSLLHLLIALTSENAAARFNPEFARSRGGRERSGG